MFRGSRLASPYLEVGDSWCIELQAGLLLAASVPVETLQQEVADGQPLTSGQLGGELEGVCLELAQFVSGVEVQPRCVHVKCAWRISGKT